MTTTKHLLDFDAIKKIAAEAKIAVSSEEIVMYRNNFSTILELIAKIDDANINNNAITENK